MPEGGRKRTKAGHYPLRKQLRFIVRFSISVQREINPFIQTFINSFNGKL